MVIGGTTGRVRRKTTGPFKRLDLNHSAPTFAVAATHPANEAGCFLSGCSAPFVPQTFLKARSRFVFGAPTSKCGHSLSAESGCPASRLARQPSRHPLCDSGRRTRTRAEGKWQFTAEGRQAGSFHRSHATVRLIDDGDSVPAAQSLWTSRKFERLKSIG